MDFDPELGIKHLKELFKRRSLQPPDELAIQEAHLLRNVRNNQRYGENPANTAEWVQIIERLIAIADEELGVNFNDLCHTQTNADVIVSLVKSRGDTDEDKDGSWPTPNYAQRQNLAVFVGVNAYDDRANYPPLQVCADDATALASQFTANGFSPDLMQVITDAHPDNLPTRGNILNTLNVVATATQPDDLLLFYYSGHGDMDLDDQESYLVARDGWAASLPATAVPFQTVKEIMQRAPARNKVIILDACHAGVAFGQKGKTRMSPAFIQRVFEQAEGLAILSSCTQNQLSYQATSLGQSAYTYFLLQALQGKADTEGKGFITVRDLNNHVTNGVKNWATQQKCTQTPTISAKMIGEIIVCSYTAVS